GIEEPNTVVQSRQTYSTVPTSSIYTPPRAPVYSTSSTYATRVMFLTKKIDPPPPPKPPVKQVSLVPVYVLGATEEMVCILTPSSETIVEIDRDAISLEDVEERQLYLTTIERGQVGGALAIPSDTFMQYCTSRDDYIFNLPGYESLVVPALLLGSRMRDFEQRCAVVAKYDPLELAMPPQTGVLKVLELETVTGEVFHVQVDRIRAEKEGLQLRLWCTPFEELPDDLREGSMLQINGRADDRLPVVTVALDDLYNRTITVDNWKLLDCIYGRADSNEYPAVQRSTLTIAMQNLQRFTLNVEQTDAVQRYNSACPAFVVESPPGSGKTMTAAAMAVSYTGSGVQLLLSTANVPVFNMALQLAKLDYGSRRAIHFVSAEKEELMSDETQSPFTVMSIAKRDPVVKAEIDELQRLMRHPKTTKEQKRELRDDIWDLIKHIAWAKYDIMFGTVDMVLGKLQRPDAGARVNTTKQQLQTSVRRVVIDEASQLTESALNALILSFPQAQIVLIGDSKQLPPFKYVEGDLVSEMAARSALDVVQDKGNLPVIELLTVYRAAPSMMKHYSNVFYDGALTSAKPESKTNPFSSFGKKAANSHCLFWKVRGKARQIGSSKANDLEIASLISIVNNLRSARYDEKSVMIISYYEAQRKLAEECLPRYEVLTVDSAQGREKKIVIVLTTRSSVPDGNAGFFNCPLRCNVALSRHQEGLIVIGHPSIAGAQIWQRVLNPQYFKHVVAQ
ncbi:hypothetical protein PFISCL1PPCAC_7576, partial [Pristionchus fissidentatus]